MGICASQRETFTISDDEILCQEIESNIHIKNIPFETFRSKILHFGPNADLSQSQLEELLAQLNIDLDAEYRNPARPLLPFMDYFFDHNTQEYRQDLLLSAALLLSQDEYYNKKKWLWWILEKQPGVIFYPQIENLCISFLEIAVVLIPSLARRFDNGMAENAQELEKLKPIKDVSQYAKKLLSELRFDEFGLNEKINEIRYEKFMEDGNGKILLNTTLLRRFVLKLMPTNVKLV